MTNFEMQVHRYLPPCCRLKSVYTIHMRCVNLNLAREKTESYSTGNTPLTPFSKSHLQLGMQIENPDTGLTEMQLFKSNSFHRHFGHCESALGDKRDNPCQDGVFRGRRNLAAFLDGWMIASLIETLFVVAYVIALRFALLRPLHTYIHEYLRHGRQTLFGIDERMQY